MFCSPASVMTPAEIFPEWITSVPLLGFMAISVDTKLNFDRDDYAFVLLLFLTVLSGSLMQIFNQSVIVANTLLAIALCLYTYAMSLSLKMIRKAQIVLKPCAVTSNTARKQFQMHIASRKIMLLYSLLILLPFFPLVYFLTYFGVYDNNMRDANIMIGGMY